MAVTTGKSGKPGKRKGDGGRKMTVGGKMSPGVDDGWVKKT